MKSVDAPSALPKSAAVATARSESIDVMKGFGIFFVIANHSFARGMRKFGGSEVSDDALLYFLNRLIHFAVPIFLFVSCALLAKSLSKRFDLKRFATARWRRTMVPYLVAATLYSIHRSGPPWLSPEAFQNFLVEVFTGKASFHLYFTIVLIQATVAIPLLVLAFRGRRIDWRVALGAGLVLQWVFFHLQREVFHVTRPGSFLFWYWVPLLLGFVAGTDPDLKQKLRPCRLQLAGLAVALGLIYSSVSISHFHGFASSSDLINGTYVAFTAFLALSLWVLVDEYPTGWLRRFLNALGRVSLPLFLIHPAVMFLIGGPRITAVIESLPLSGLVYWGLTLGITYLLAQGLIRLKPGRFILGERSLAPSTAATT